MMVTMKTIYMETDAARLYLNDGRVLEHFWLEYQFLSSKEQTLKKMIDARNRKQPWDVIANQDRSQQTY